MFRRCGLLHLLCVIALGGCSANEPAGPESQLQAQPKIQECSTGGADPIVIFDPSSFLSTEDLRSSNFWSGSENDELIELVDDKALGGKAMRYTFRIPDCRTQVVTKIFDLPIPLREVWIYLQFRTSPNFTTQDPVTCRPGDYKWLFGGVDLPHGRWHVQMGLFGSVWNIEVVPRQPAPKGTLVGGVFGDAAATWDSQVHEIMIHWKYPSTSAAQDAVAAMCVDGDKIAEFTGSVNSDSRIVRIEMGKNMSGHAEGDLLPAESSEHMYLYWGRLEVYDQDPTIKSP